MTRAERDLAHAAFYEGRGRIGDYRHRHEAQVEFLSAYDEEYEPPGETHVPRKRQPLSPWPVAICVTVALLALKAPWLLGMILACFAIALGYRACVLAGPHVRAFVRRLPEVAVDCILIVGAAIAWVCAFAAHHVGLWALSWRVVLMASVEMAGIAPLPHYEAPAEAIAFELDLANPEAFTAVAPF